MNKATTSTGNEEMDLLFTAKVIDPDAGLNGQLYPPRIESFAESFYQVFEVKLGVGLSS